MPPSLLLIAAQALTMAQMQPIGPADYPEDKLRGEKSAAVIVEVFVGTDGKALRCNQQTAIGDMSFGEFTCRKLQKKHWKPARLRDGTTSPALYFDVIRWFVPGNRIGDQVGMASMKPDIVLNVQSLPAGQKGPVNLNTVILVNEDGSIIQCDGDKPEADQVFVRAACGSLLGRQFIKTSSIDGKPTAYVSKARVQFVVDPGLPVN